MRIAGLVGSSLVVGFGFLACSSGGAGALNDDGGSPETQTPSNAIDSGRRARDAERDDAPSSRDSATAKDAKADAALGRETGPKVCVSNCLDDTECQSSCPASPGGVNCCDTASGVCYASSSSSCGAVDAGMD